MAPCHVLTTRFTFTRAIPGASPKSRNASSKRLVIRWRVLSAFSFITAETPSESGRRDCFDGESCIAVVQGQRCHTRNWREQWDLNSRPPAATQASVGSFVVNSDGCGLHATHMIRTLSGCRGLI